jgi:hypothetical protein
MLHHAVESFRPYPPSKPGKRGRMIRFLPLLDITELTQLSVRRHKPVQFLIVFDAPEQNGHMESFHKTLKREYVWTRDFQSFQEASEALQEAHIAYNQKRIHSSLGYITPHEFLAKVKVTQHDR